jgi:hypothetical protein
MAHIPQHKLLPQDLVHMHDHGPKDNRHPEPTRHTMHASDAMHAMDSDPERWTLEGDKPAEAAESAPRESKREASIRRRQDAADKEAD